MVDVSVKKMTMRRIRVADTGIGISMRKGRDIRSFYQVDDSRNKEGFA